MVQFSRAMNNPDLTQDQLSGFFNYRYDISAEVPFTQQDHELIRQTLQGYTGEALQQVLTSLPNSKAKALLVECAFANPSQWKDTFFASDRPLLDINKSRSLFIALAEYYSDHRIFFNHLKGKNGSLPNELIDPFSSFL